MVVYSGSNTDYKSSEPLKTLVMLCYVMQFFSEIEAGSNRSWNAKEDTTVSIQLILHPASIALRNSIELRVNTAEAGYLMKIIITQFNRRWHHCMCPCIQLPLNSLMILFIKNI